MSIGLLYEQPESDERGIRLTAEEMGVELVSIPFNKMAISLGSSGFGIRTKGKDYFDDVKKVGVVLNRAQSKNRRLYAATTIESLGKKSLNSSSVEFRCYSKLRTLTRLWSVGIPIPKTVYVPSDPCHETDTGKKIGNEPEIAELIEREIGKAVVIKPDAGTHGKGILLSKDTEELIANIQKTGSSIINPVGILAQEFVEKWFYDLRIIVSKEKGKKPVCHPVALARAGFEDFRTNASLGNLVFDAKLPQHVRNLALKCGSALGGENGAWVLGLDAMIRVGKNKTGDEKLLKSELAAASVKFDDIKRVKRDDSRFSDFKAWNKSLETAFRDYKSTEHYSKVKTVIEESMDANRRKVVFHEANSCPDFWENTRLIAGINVAIPLIKGAKSLIKA